MLPTNQTLTPAEPGRLERVDILRGADGRPLLLERAADEMVMLAYDPDMRRHVEVHVLKGMADAGAVQRRSSLARALLATEASGTGFMRVLSVGEDDGEIFYEAGVIDGEIVTRYIARRGALPAATALCVVLRLLDDLVQMQSCYRLMAGVSLSPLLITTDDDARLRLSVVDFGLARKEGPHLDDQSELCAEVCALMFLLVAGQPRDHSDEMALAKLAFLPATLRGILFDPGAAPASLDELHEVVDVALTALVPEVERPGMKERLLAADDDLQPLQPLHELLIRDEEKKEAALKEWAGSAAISSARKRSAAAAFVVTSVICLVLVLAIAVILMRALPPAGTANAADAPSATPPAAPKPVQPPAPVPAPAPPPAPALAQSAPDQDIIMKAVIPTREEVDAFRKNRTADLRPGFEPQVTDHSTR